jgi:hypothetical protein
MDEASKADVTERLAALERENRRLLWIGGAIVAGAIVLVAEGSGLVRPAGVLEARGLLLKDPAGKVRGRFDVASDGSPRLALLDDQGRDQATLSSTYADSTVLTLYEKGKKRAELSALSHGDSSLSFFDGANDTETAIVLRPDNTLALSFRGPERFVSLALVADSAEGLRFVDEAGRERGRIRLSAEELRDLHKAGALAAPARPKAITSEPGGGGPRPAGRPYVPSAP